MSTRPPESPAEPAPGGPPTGFDWRGRYESGHTPWDLGGPHPELLRRLELGELGRPRQDVPLRAFLPGSGRGHDALALARAGFRVTAIEWIPEIAAASHAQLEPLGGRCLEGDALAFDETGFDLVFEHTFFCAIPREHRPRWGQLIDRTLAPGGLLAALVFPADKPESEGGPPFGVTAADLAGVLPQGIVLLEDVPAERTIERRRWAERWASFRRAER